MNHRDRRYIEIHILREKSNTKTLACTRAFYMGLASSEGKKLSVLNEQQIIFL
jgi:hypothetical protein